jgi:prepilin-type N-terminal cleavage/methylation domain-containing protein
MKIKKISGFTLIELIVVITITGIIVSGSSILLLHGAKAYLEGRNDLNAIWQANIAIEKMSRDLRTIPSSSYISTANADRFSFIDVNGASIDYQVVNSNLLRNAQVLASNTSSIAFTYYDKNGATTTTIANIYYINVVINVFYGSSTFNISTTVGLWNMT